MGLAGHIMLLLRSPWLLLLFILIHLVFVTAKFEPYADNGGTVVGIAGRDYAIIAADTRLSENYMIRSRNVTKIFEVSS